MTLEKEFSKKYTQEERDKLAQDIKKTRKKFSRDWSSWGKEEINEESLKTQETHEDLKKDFIGRLFKTREFLRKKMVWDVLIKEQKKEKIEKTQSDFKRKLEETLEEIPLSEEEQEKYLSEEALINMSLDDYLLLLKRLSGNYVSHVTRYGIREQTFMSTGGGHRAGEGEFMDNFTPILKEKKLNSFFTNVVNRTNYAKERIADRIKFFQEDKKDINRDELIKEVWKNLMRDLLAFSIPGDKSGFHMAIDDILGCYYGSEYNYDIYFYFPAEFIAKNYIHHAKLAGGSPRTYERKGWTGWYNDLIIWNEGKGISVDAGICCIPEDVEVDEKTGSQYRLDKNKKPIPNPEIEEHVSFSLKNSKLFDKVIEDLARKERELDLYNHPENKKEFDKYLFPTSKELEFKDDEIFRSFYEKYKITIPKDLEEFYRQSRLYYLKPEKTIFSKEYWEKYFKENPDKRPNKIVYYRFYFEPQPHARDKNDRKREVLGELEQKTFKNIGELPQYQEYMQAVSDEIKKVISEVYDELHKK